MSTDVESYRLLQSSADRVTAVVEERNRQVESLLTQIAHSSKMVALNDDMTSLIELIQDVVYRKQMAQYESLLTKFVFAVLKDLGRNVHLTMEIKGSSPHLNVMVDNEGNLEDAWKGNGGALTNVLSAGLRLISLYKVVSLGHNIRPFIVFDEVDNWVADDNVVDFYSNLISLSTNLGLQSIIVTHKAVESFYSLPEVQVISLSGKPLDTEGVKVKVFSPHDLPFKSEIRSVHLRNFRGYVDQIIPLSPSCTIINGKNNIGKSAIIDAIRSVSGIDGGEADVIRHGCQSTSVTFDLGETKLTWTRNLKKTPVIVYTLTSSTGEIIKETPSTAGKAPDWVSARDVLGIKEVDDVDIQLKNQKDSVFMLNLSGPKRASILTIGSEAKWIDTIQKHWKSGLQWHKSKLKESEKTLEETRRILLKLPAGYDQWAHGIHNSVSDWRRSNKVLSTMNTVQERVRSVISAQKIIDNLHIPSIESTIEVAQCADTIGAAIRYVELASKKLPSVPDRLYDVNMTTYNINNVIKVEELSRRTNIHIPILENSVEVTVYKNVYDAIKSKLTLDREMSAIASEIDDVGEQAKKVATGLEMLKDSWDECPLCGTDLHHSHTTSSASAQTQKTQKIDKTKRRNTNEPIQSNLLGM